MGWIDRASITSARALAVVGLGTLLFFAIMTVAVGLLRYFLARGGGVSRPSARRARLRNDTGPQIRYALNPTRSAVMLRDFVQ
jgi:hypothetical protein